MRTPGGPGAIDYAFETMENTRRQSHPPCGKSPTDADRLGLDNRSTSLDSIKSDSAMSLGAHGILPLHSSLSYTAPTTRKMPNIFSKPLTFEDIFEYELYSEGAPDGFEGNVRFISSLCP